MKFRRLDENSIRCIISKEEMDEHGIGIDDLMDDREKAESFLRYVLHEADEELDFKTDAESINVQLTVTPSGDVSMMITDDAQSAINHMISQFKDSIKDIKEMIEESEGEAGRIRRTEIDDALVSKWKPEVFDKEDSKKSHKKEDGKESPEEMLETTIWMEFKSMDKAMRLAHIAEELQNNESSLYKYRGTYYLKLPLNVPRKDVARLAFAFGEYCDKMYYETPESLSIVEHGQCLVHGNALEVLQKL